jgi:hypothetical protein
MGMNYTEPLRINPPKRSDVCLTLYTDDQEFVYVGAEHVVAIRYNARDDRYKSSEETHAQLILTNGDVVPFLTKELAHVQQFVFGTWPSKRLERDVE